MGDGLYLGRQVDPVSGDLGAPLELDPADLLTHGLIVGMTGSGKTGLALVLLEELLRQGVPIIAIDPKGDLGNLLLLFDTLDATSFEPWIDAEAARRDGKDVPTAARDTAETWKNGLAEWGLGPADIAAVKKTHDAVVYTPGSSAGVPLNVLQSLDAPSVPFDSAEEDLRDEIGGIVAGLLMGTWMVGTLQTEQDRDRLDDGLTGAGLEKAAVERLLGATRKRVFLLHDVHRAEPCLLHSRWAMSYLRGPLTRDEIGRLKSAGPAVPPVPAESSLAEGPPLLPAPFEPLYLPRHGGGLAHVHLVVKHAVRYKGAGETVGLSAWPLAGATAAEALEAERFAVEEGTLEDAAPEGLEYGAVPEWLDGGAAKAIEKALRDRLPDKLAARVYADPLIGERSGPGETREDFARRLRASGGGEAAEKVREQLEKKKTALKVLEEEVEGRRQEKWFAVGKAVLRMTGLLGRRRSSSGVSTVLTKDRLEDKAEARLEAARAVLADLERELAEILDVDPRRLQEETLTPGRGGVKVLRRDLVWVY